MAKAVPILWQYQPTADGRCLLRLRLSDAHQTLYVSLGVRVHPRDWNDRQRRVRRGHPDANEINELISGRLAAAETARVRLLAAGERPSAAAVQSALAARSGDVDPCFLQYVETFLVGVEQAGNVARVDREQAVIAKLRAHLAGAPGGATARRLSRGAREAAAARSAAVRLPFSRLSPELLRAFEGYLLSEVGNSTSTVQSNMTILRLHTRRAIKEGRLARERDPFFSYSPPRASQPERAKLREDQITRLEALDLGEAGPGGSLDARVRDAFLFSLYAAGIRFGDLVRLHRGDLTAIPAGDGPPVLRLAYTASKTGKRTSVLVAPPAARLVAPYLVHADGRDKEPGEFLFPVLVDADGRPRYDLSTPRGFDRAVSSQNALFNKTLKRLGAAASIEATLSMHVARHSFADLARRRGWGLHDIRQALRHSSLTTTERYLAGFDSDTLDAHVSALFSAGDAP